MHCGQNREVVCHPQIGEWIGPLADAASVRLDRSPVVSASMSSGSCRVARAMPWL